MRIRFSQSNMPSPGSPASIALVSGDAPTEELTTRERAKARRLPSDGNLAPPEMGTFDLVRGSRPIAPSVAFGSCGGYAFDAVVEAVRNPEQVWEGYVDQARTPATDPYSQTHRGAFRGGEATVFWDYFWGTLTQFQDRSGATHMLIQNCGE